MAKIVTTTPHVDVINNHFFGDVPVEGAQVREGAGAVAVEEPGISAISMLEGGNILKLLELMLYLSRPAV